jgi:MFS transporter, ACS family, D-galactonate transporter
MAQQQVQTDVPMLTPAMRWTVLFLLATGVMIAFVDRTSISTVLADKAFIKDFALTGSGRGWIGSAFFWSYGLAHIYMGWLVDRYGVKIPYAICFAVWCLATAATGYMGALAGIVLMRFIVGAAEAIVMPASYRWIRNHFKEGETGLAVGILAAGNKLGPALGAPVAAWFIGHSSWKVMFVATGLLGLIWLIPWMLLVKNDKPKANEIAAVKRKAATVSYASIFSSPVVWGAMIVNFCYGYFSFFCMTWMPAYLVEQRGLSLTKSSLYTAFTFIGFAIVGVLSGWFADKMIARGGDPVKVRKGFVIAGFIGASTVLLGAYAQTLGAALFWNVASLCFLGLATANNLALSRLTLIPSAAVGRVTGVQQVATALAGGVSAALSGWLLERSGGYTLPMLVIFVFLVIGAFATAILLRPEWSPKVTEEVGA